jgi:hypothetical protein
MRMPGFLAENSFDRPANRSGLTAISDFHEHDSVCVPQGVVVPAAISAVSGIDCAQPMIAEKETGQVT